MPRIPARSGLLVLLLVAWIAVLMSDGNADGAYLPAAMLLIFGVSALARLRNPARFINRMADTLYPVRHHLVGFVAVLILFGAAAIWRKRVELLLPPVLYFSLTVLVWKLRRSKPKPSARARAQAKAGRTRDDAGSQRTSTVHDAHLRALGLKVLPGSREALAIAWKTQIRRVHPDVPGGSVEKAKAVNAAYEALSGLYPAP